MSDIAYELLFQRKNPSWLYSVDNGATTIWERWNSYMLDKGMGPQGMNSFNHYAYGCVCEWGCGRPWLVSLRIRWSQDSSALS